MSKKPENYKEILPKYCEKCRSKLEYIENDIIRDFDVYTGEAECVGVECILICPNWADSLIPFGHYRNSWIEDRKPFIRIR